MSLLELARSLNIVETIQLNAGTLMNSKQNFKYLIVIDFEATCWKKGDAKWRKPEIIGKRQILSVIVICMLFNKNQENHLVSSFNFNL